MSESPSPLQEKVLDVFERACQEDDLEVAEHLLQALEVMAKRTGNEGRLDGAYLRFAWQPR